MIVPQILRGFSSWRWGERCGKAGAGLCKLLLAGGSEACREAAHRSAAGGGPRRSSLSCSCHGAAHWHQVTSAAASTKLVLNTAQCRLTDLQVPKRPPEYCTKWFPSSGHTTAVCAFEFQVVLTKLMKAPNAADEEQLGSPECTSKAYSVSTYPSPHIL